MFLYEAAGILVVASNLPSEVTIEVTTELHKIHHLFHNT